MDDHKPPGIKDLSASHHEAAEREQAELVETLKLAESIASVGPWQLDVATGRVRWSDEVYRIHGVSPASFDPSYDDAVGFYHPDDPAALKAEQIDRLQAAHDAARKIGRDILIEIIASKHGPVDAETTATALAAPSITPVSDSCLTAPAIAASDGRRPCSRWSATTCWTGPPPARRNCWATLPWRWKPARAKRRKRACRWTITPRT